MAHPLFHARSSAKKFGGVPEDYLQIHAWFDQTKAHLPDLRHRAVLHSSFGIFLCEQVFGLTIRRSSDGKEVPVRPIGEQHVVEDLGRIPTIEDWLENLPLKDWMLRGASSLSKELDDCEERTGRRQSGSAGCDQ